MIFEQASLLNKDWSNPAIPGQARPNRNSRGIRNSNGVSCYQNSPYQAFAHTPAFVNWILSHVSTTHPGTVPASCFACLMKDLISLYWGSSNPRTAITSNANELRRIRQFAYLGLFAPNQQSDADEYYNWLLSQLEFLGSALGYVNQFHASVRTTMLTCYSGPTWDTEFRTLYTFTHESLLRCSNCHHRRTLPPTNDTGLSLPLRDTNGHQLHTLEEALSAFLKDEIQVNCPSCSPHASVDQEKTIRILAAPAILKLSYKLIVPIVQNGVTTGFHKIRRPIPYPASLDLNKAGQAGSALPLRYKLSSVISHHGDVNAGHYIATAKGPVDTFQISDSVVNRVNPANLLDNPQCRNGQSFQVYTLTFLRDYTRTRADRKMERDLGVDMTKSGRGF